MAKTPHILLLAGSFEARQLAEALSARGLRHTALISEPPRGPAPLPQPPVLRRFERTGDLAQWATGQGVTSVLDASHMFDRRQTYQALAVARAGGMPYLRLERPAWPVPEGQAQAVGSVTAARALIPPGARVFAATGWDSLQDYAPFPGARLFLRQTRRHDRPAPLPFVELAFGDPPFTAQDERATFEALRIDTLICRNLGGAASRPKLDAALALGLRTILIDRPPLPPGCPAVASVAEALARGAP